MKLTQHRLRDLFWITLVAAMATGWSMDRIRLARLEAYFERTFGGCNVGPVSGALISKVPLPVEGIVTSVDTSNSLVSISVGSDDGLRRGQLLEVYRGSKYCGVITLSEMSCDGAVGIVDRKMQRARILKDDRVTSKLAATTSLTATPVVR